MSKNIELSDTTFSRLEKLAVGFDSPESVIIRLLDGAEGKTETKPVLTFFPSDENVFKLKLIESKEAEVVMYKHDSTREITHWKANRLSETSNLRGNLWSGILRGWKSKGIDKVELSVLPQDEDSQQIKILALELQLTFDEMSQLTYELDQNESEDGLIYNYIVQFDDGNDKEILSKIDGLTEHLWVNVDTSAFS
ncbi:hypothetical protein J8Z28_03840 [Pseudoalteromonas sp. SCSIO 43088]|uniref:hypothetical protein n=1 Tax=Pseudoalteromonas sp. SCSIO 43088 TaxID=2822846 RepID=UPI00202BA15B|nr:hypothetical protein [Pseudoalteromonas sp. SCSIO 43088]URQ87037.1 hypothetical protein J8Z28_03840 [Pseudoalteromonas sp. SCSIO 43088]